MRDDAQTPETAVPLRALPRRVQATIGLLLVVAITVGIVLFNREYGGTSITDPGATLPKVGDHLAAIPLTDATGAPFDMATLAGRPIWINIWASWCAPCRIEMPDLQAAYDQEKQLHPDLVLLFLNTADNKADGTKFFQSLHLTSTLVFNNGSRDLGPYRVQNFPTSILVDRHGVVRRVLQQSVDGESATRELQVILR